MLANGVMGVGMGINIFSGSKECNGLGAALTNPTALALRKGTLRSAYPVTVRGRTFKDSEAAYQTLKRESDRMSFAELKELMVEVLICKLEQYPRLVTAIDRRGGVAWLESCRHVVNGGRWEGNGVESAFIGCLIKAFTHIACS